MSVFDDFIPGLDNGPLDDFEDASLTLEYFDEQDTDGSAYDYDDDSSDGEDYQLAELLPHFTCHNARHTFASRMCEQVSDEVVLKSVQAILGHASFETTMDVYAKANEKKNKQAMIAMSRCAVFG